MPLVLIHIQSEDAVMGEIDALPSPTDTILTIRNPRRRDGKDITYIDASVTTVLWPIARINFIEIMPGEEEEEIITFVREG
jgi:hypothetical protein